MDSLSCMCCKLGHRLIPGKCEQQTFLKEMRAASGVIPLYSLTSCFPFNVNKYVTLKIHSELD